MKKISLLFLTMMMTLLTAVTAQADVIVDPIEILTTELLPHVAPILVLLIVIIIVVVLIIRRKRK